MSCDWHFYTCSCCENGIYLYWFLLRYNFDILFYSHWPWCDPSYVNMLNSSVYSECYNIGLNEHFHSVHYLGNLHSNVPIWYAITLLKMISNIKDNIKTET